MMRFFQNYCTRKKYKNHTSYYVLRFKLDCSKTVFLVKRLTNYNINSPCLRFVSRVLFNDKRTHRVCVCTESLSYDLPPFLENDSFVFEAGKFPTIKPELWLLLLFSFFFFSFVVVYHILSHSWRPGMY